MQHIYTLGADGQWICLIGMFSTKEKANKAWKIWKDTMRGTVWAYAKKKLSAERVDVILDDIEI